MVFVKPKQGISNEEVFHLIAAIIKDQRAPVHVLAKARVFMFVKTGAVIARKAVRILRKVARYPIEDHSDAGLMATVHEIAELVGISVPARRRVKVDDLIAPRTVERMLHHGQQFDVRESQLLDVGDQAVAELYVTQEAIFLLRVSLPRTEMHLIGTH